MRNLLFALLTTFSSTLIFSQVTKYDRMISELKAKQQKECAKNPTNCAAISSQIQAAIAEIENRKYSESSNDNNQRQQDEARATSERLSQQQNSFQNPTANGFSYYQNIGNDMNIMAGGFMQGVRNMQQAQMLQELQQWNQMKSDFFYLNNDKLNKVAGIYNTIGANQFKPLADGYYKGYYISKSKFSFSEDKEVSTTIDAIVNVEKNKIIQIFPEGKVAFGFNVNPTSIKAGVANFIDVENLKTSTIVIIDPYLIDDYINPIPKQTETAKVIFWTTDRGDEGKLILVQERGQDNKILRETQTKLNYAKNEKELAENLENASVNSNRAVVFYGSPRNTPFGVLPRMLKVDSRKSVEPLKEGEIRFVRIKKYGF